ncbi:MAG TPA: hypothetical protein VFB84_11195 [Micromonosporaceae bacterium]|nr:hypothetical protein [Micromonosporaceae bacterium]
MRSFSSGTPLAGRYVLVDRLATGPDATVWRGLDDVLGRPVAVKVFTSAVHDADDRAWIHQRARTAARLAHPHAAAVYDFGDARGLDGTLLPYVVLELLDGVPLAERLADGPLPWPLSVRTLAEVASALAAAHARGVVHGDLGPGSVLLTEVGAKLIGFAGPTRAPRVELTSADDVRALGVLLGTTLLGTEPHAGTPAEAFARVVGSPAPALGQPARVAELPGDVPAVCLACLALRPDERPSAEQVARRLAAVVAQVAATVEGAEVLLAPAVPARQRASAHRHATQPRRAWGRVHPGLVAAGGLLVVLAASGLASGVGEDLLSAATGHGRPDRDSGATAPGGDGAGTAAGTVPGGSPGGAPTGPGGSPTPVASPEPSGSTMPSPSFSMSPTASPAAYAVALARLRATVDEGRSAAQIAPDVAVDLDQEIDEIDKAPRRMMPSLVAKLKRHIDDWTRSSSITSDRAELLHEAVDDWYATVASGGDEAGSSGGAAGSSDSAADSSDG